MNDFLSGLGKVLGLGLAANAALAVPYYLLIEVPHANEEDPDESRSHRAAALLGTEAQCVVPWLFVATHLPIVVLGTALAVRTGCGLRESILAVDTSVGARLAERL